MDDGEWQTALSSIHYPPSSVLYLLAALASWRFLMLVPQDHSDAPVLFEHAVFQEDNSAAFIEHRLDDLIHGIFFHIARCRVICGSNLLAVAVQAGRVAESFLHYERIDASFLRQTPGVHDAGGEPFGAG